MHTASAQRQRTLSRRRTCLRAFSSDPVTGKASPSRIILPVGDGSPHMYESASYTGLFSIAATRNRQCKGSSKDPGRSSRIRRSPVVSMRYLVVEPVRHRVLAGTSGGGNVPSVLYKARLPFLKG